MNHVHDRAVSNGHLLTPCHVDFNSKDSYMVTIDVIALMSFRQGITSSLSSVTSSKFFVIILAPTCYTSMALTASLQHFWFLPTFALARHPILWSWELFDLRSDSFYLCDLEVSFQQLCCGGGVAALTLICLSLKKKASAAGLSPEEYNYSQHFEANMKTCSQLPAFLPKFL